MNIFLLILCICLFILCPILSIKIIHTKIQMSKFEKDIILLKNEDYNKKITVECFDKQIVSLANSLNDYISFQNNICKKYKNDRKHLNRVIAGISHDFRTPLTAAMGYMQMIEKNESLNENDKKYLSVAINKISYLKELSDDFFELSVFETNDGDFETNKTNKINLNNLLSDVILEQYNWVTERNITANFKICNEDIFINSNEKYLKRIIYNLFSNIQKYIKSYLNFSCEYKGKDIVLTFENDVENCHDIDVKNIFDCFYREKSRSKEGSGLGLYVVKCLCEKLGYKVEAKCTKGKFFITLTIHKAKY